MLLIVVAQHNEKGRPCGMLICVMKWASLGCRWKALKVIADLGKSKIKINMGIPSVSVLWTPWGINMKGQWLVWSSYLEQRHILQESRVLIGVLDFRTTEINSGLTAECLDTSITPWFSYLNKKTGRGDLFLQSFWTSVQRKTFPLCCVACSQQWSCAFRWIWGTNSWLTPVA